MENRICQSNSSQRYFHGVSNCFSYAFSYLESTNSLTVCGLKSAQLNGVTEVYSCVVKGMYLVLQVLLYAYFSLIHMIEAKCTDSFIRLFKRKVALVAEFQTERTVRGWIIPLWGRNYGRQLLLRRDEREVQVRAGCPLFEQPVVFLPDVFSTFSC